MKIKKNNFWKLLSAMLVMIMVLSACGASSSIADITFVIGNGTYDQDIHEIIYPGQQRTVTLDDRTTKVAPGNYRNYIINDGSRKNLDGTTVGDSAELLDTVIPSGTKVEVGLTALWMLNQSAYITPTGEYKGPLVEFYKFASKYNALNTTNDASGNVNASTPGWNLMLSENFYNALWHALDQALYNIQNDYDSLTGNPMVFPIKIDDNIYKTDGVKQKEVLANEISRLFQSEIAKMTGSNEKMFCGSGAQSGWKNPTSSEAGKPGNEFVCADVRIKIDSVIYNPNQGNTSGSQSLIDANSAEWDAAYELYHDQTDCWLGIQKTAEICAQSGSSCVITIDAGSCNTTNADGSQKPTTIILPNDPTPAPVDPAATPIP